MSAAVVNDRPARSPLPTLFLTAFIDLLGFGLTIPLLPFYAQRYGASALQVSLLFASFSLMGFLFVLTVGFVYEWRKGALDWE